MATRRKTKKKRRLSADKLRLLFALLAMAVLIVVFILVDSGRFKVKVKRYPQFGIDIPVEYTLHGIDVSRYQKKIFWNEVKAMDIEGISIDFAFMKATEGENDVDVQFKRNWRQAQLQKIPRGAYHFFLPSRDPVKQAMNFIKNVSLKKGDLPPVLDVEQTGNLTAAEIQQRTKIWLDIVEQHYGVRPVLYTYVSFYNKYLGDAFDKYPLWVAHYYEKRKPKIKREWIFWQHNDAGRVNGIDAYVDFNVFNGDSVAFQQLLKK